VSVQMVIELREKGGAQPILQAIESYKARLRASIERTQRRLAQFEQRYGVDTAHFVQEMTAEDLEGGDLEYVEWAGEARLLEGLQEELIELEHARYQLP
jgi:sugar phosphate isomerase/epimerase